MEIVVTARHTEVAARFRRHLEEKLAKVDQLAPRAQRLEVGVSHEVNKRQAATCERIEITVVGKGPVVRAEACADDPYVALDLATTKLFERLRRERDRRKVHHSHTGGRHAVASVRTGGAPAGADAAGAPGGAAPGVDLDGAASGDHAHGGVLAARTPLRPPAPDASGDVATEYAMGESPVVIRDKVHVGAPMALDDALVEMELVGHDFFLFTDAETGCPSVVYRRHGWSYGVIRLAADAAQAERVVAALGGGAAGSPTEQPPAPADTPVAVG